MTRTLFGDAMTFSGRSFRLTVTLLLLMLPIFFIGRVLGLSQQPANLALRALATGAAVAAVVGTVAVVWNR